MGLVRPCVLCGQQDDHPRHIVVLEGGVESLRHKDCCANMGCPGCAAELAIAGVPAGTTGDALRDALVNNVTDEAVQEFIGDPNAVPAHIDAQEA